MALSYSVEVAVPEGTSTTEIGRVFEKFARKILEQDGYEVVETVRIKGAEVDLLARNRSTNEKICVECKAHRQTIPSKVLRQLIGDIALYRYSEGWLITASALSKDAKGVREEWNNQPEPERSRLKILEPDQLVSKLIELGTVAPPESLQIPSGYLASEAVCLVLTQHRTYWAAPLLDNQSGVWSAVAFYDASDGVIVDAESYCQKLVTRVSGGAFG